MATLRQQWTTEQEDSLCDLVTSTGEMMKAVKAATGTVGDYWTMVAGILWQAEGIRTSGEGCRKRWGDCNQRYFEDMKARMEAEAAETEAAEPPDAFPELSKWDELAAKIRTVEEMSDREIAEEMHPRLDRMELSLDVVEECCLRICKDLGVKIPSSGERAFGRPEVEEV